jgi:hypothetical protein
MTAEVCQQLRKLHLTVWYNLCAERLPDLRPRLIGTVGDAYGKGPMESTPLQESSSRRNCTVTGWSGPNTRRHRLYMSYRSWRA